MKTPWMRTLLLAFVVLTVLSLLLSACGPGGDLRKKDNNARNEEQLNHKEKEKNKDDTNGQEVKEEGAAEKITICHRTGSAKHPYTEIKVPNDALQDGHSTHAGDIIPAPKEGCPGAVIATDVPAK